MLPEECFYFFHLWNAFPKFMKCCCCMPKFYQVESSFHMLRSIAHRIYNLSFCPLSSSSPSSSSSSSSSSSPRVSARHPNAMPFSQTNSFSKLKLAPKLLHIHPFPHKVGQIAAAHLCKHPAQRFVQIGTLILHDQPVQLLITRPFRTTIATTHNLSCLFSSFLLYDLVHGQRA